MSNILSAFTGHGSCLYIVSYHQVLAISFDCFKISYDLPRAAGIEEQLFQYRYISLLYPVVTAVPARHSEVFGNHGQPEQKYIEDPLASSPDTSSQL